MALAFMDSIKADGWFVNLYTNIDFIKSGRFSAATIKNYDVWLAITAERRIIPTVSSRRAGTVSGITGNVDTDVAFKDYPTIIHAGGYNGYSKRQNTAVKIDTTMDISFVHGTYYTVKTTSPQQVIVTAGTGGVVTIVPFPRIRNDQLFALVAIGQAGQETGIYTAAPGEKPLRRFKYKIK
jgi:hypothetical protein